MTEGERKRRRRRRRPAPSAPAGTAQATPQASTVAAADPAPVPEPPAARRRPREAPVERGLRDLVGAGHSVVGVSGALRGRDVNRPTEEDLAAAEREVTIVRRHWKPPTDG